MMIEEQSSWLDTVAQLRQLGRLEEALRYCQAMLQKYPTNTNALSFQAMLFYELDRLEEALQAYQDLAHTFASRGDYLQALAAAKDLYALNPQASAELTEQLASQYQMQQDTAPPQEQISTQDFPPFTVEATLPTFPSLPSFPQTSGEDLDEEKMLSRLIRLQQGTSDEEVFEYDTDGDTGGYNNTAKAEDSASGTSTAETPPPLPPLFHQLDPASTAAIWASMETLRLAAGERIITQGEEGESFYIIVDGTVLVSHEVEGDEEELGHLGAGQFFGEIALLTPLRRTAHVTTISDCKILRLDRVALESIITQHPNVHQELKRFVYQRLIHNLLVSSLIFFPLSDIKRWELAQQFSVVEVPSTYPVLTEGEPVDGLYLVAGGIVELYKTQDNGAVQLIDVLGPGQFFGELSLLTRAPSPCTMTSREATSFLKLNADDFYRVMEQYPRVLDLLQAVASQRSRELRMLEQ